MINNCSNCIWKEHICLLGKTYPCDAWDGGRPTKEEDEKTLKRRASGKLAARAYLTKKKGA